MYDIDQYMLLSREERTKHLKLQEACIERGGHRNNYRGVLAEYLNTSFPNDRKINLCHACNNGLCSNPNHLYWGWASENTADQKVNGTWLSIAERTKNKLGDKYLEHLSNTGRKGGKAQRKKKLPRSSEEEQPLDKR